MERSEAISYVYAKACGILAKSFVGKRAKKLFEVNNITELWRLVLNQDLPLLPESMLAQKLEEQCKENFLKTFDKLVAYFDNPAQVLLCLQKDDRLEKDTGLKYARELWNSTNKIMGEEKASVESLVHEYLIIENIVWALRLRVYYEMTPEEIIPHLASLDGKASLADPLACEAIKILEKQLDVRDDWKNWKYEKLLNPIDEGSFWKLDPCWVQYIFNVFLVKKAKKVFRENPFNVAMLVAFYIIKKQELTYIRSATEGLRLGVDEDERLQWQKQHL